MLEEGIALRDEYLANHGLNIRDFGLNYQFPPIPPTNWDWYKTFKFGYSHIYKRFGLYLVYIGPHGDPYLLEEVPYGVVRFLGKGAGIPEGEVPPKMVSPWGRRSELHFEPIRDGRSWDDLEEGTKVIHCESFIKAKCVHKYTGIPCIGYNGVNGWSSNRLGVELIHKYYDFDFTRVDNVILFDSDVLTNPKVAAARENLAHKMRHILNCPNVSWIDLPQKENDSDPPSNWGADDFIVSKGVDELLKLLKDAKPYRDEEYSDLVEEVNQKLRWVRDQSAVYDRRGRRLMRWQEAVLDLKPIHRTIIAGKGKKLIFGTDVWLQSKHREEVDSIGYRYLDGEFFTRGDEQIANEYIKDGADPGTTGFDSEDIIWRMLRRLFGADDRELLRSYLKFLKFTGDKPTSYCILWSAARGVGKGWFTEFACSLLGRRHVAPATADSLAEKYNGHTINTRLVIVHEFQASSGANRKLALNYLKHYVGDEMIMVRMMHRNPYRADARGGLIITVNDKTDMPSDGLGDRRQWYVESAAGEEKWEPTQEEWEEVWKALKDPEMMARAARWVLDGEDIDFKSWRPPLTEERTEDLIEGQSTRVQIAHEVLIDMRELGVRVMDSKAIRALMIEKMEGQELYLVGKSFGKCLKEAGWWTDERYARLTQPNRTAGWFTAPTNVSTGEAIIWMKEDAPKAGRKY